MKRLVVGRLAVAWAAASCARVVVARGMAVRPERHLRGPVGMVVGVGAAGVLRGRGLRACGASGPSTEAAAMSGRAMTATVVRAAPAARAETARSVRAARRTRAHQREQHEHQRQLERGGGGVAQPDRLRAARARAQRGRATKRVWAHTAATATLPAIVAHSSR